MKVFTPIYTSAFITLVCVAMILLAEWQPDHSVWIDPVRTAFGAIFILYIPGYWVSRCFFASGKIDILERVVFSFGLSITTVPLLVFYANLMGLKITTWSVVCLAILIIIASITTVHVRSKKSSSS